MVTQLLTTKLYIPPIRPELVPRPRLVKTLTAGLHHKLTLVSAPAGFGKTTLVNTWLRSTDMPVAWISLDEDDNDIVRFLNYLVTALIQIDDEIGQSGQRLLDAPQLPPVEQLLTELINKVASRSLLFVLVLDDYQVINDLDVHKAINFLLERQPPSMHLVIVSRQDPPIPLSRLRGRDQVTEIRQRDLRFSTEEAATFLNQVMDVNLPVSEVAALEAQTEGWITGLQMVALALQSHIAESGKAGVPRFIANFSGRHHFILDYLTDEVLGHLPEQIYRFLLQTSILNRMCSSLCDALLHLVTGDNSTFASSREILEYLHHANLFVVPLDDEEKWYRYHRLFAELLQARLQVAAADQVPELYLRASAWCEQNDLLAEAVTYAIAIPDYALAAGVIERSIPRISSWSSVNVAIFREWLKVLPGDIVRARPRLRLFTSRVFYLIGQREETERILQELEESLSSNTSIPDADEILGSVIADRASYAAVRGDVKQAIQLARRAGMQLPGNAMMRMRLSVISGLAHFRAGKVLEAGKEFSEAITTAESMKLGFVAAPIFCNLAEVYIAQGQLHQAYQICQQSMEMATIDGKPTSMAGFPGLELGKILYEQNDLPLAEQYLSEALALLSRSGTTDSFGIGHALLARIKQARGEDRGALAAIRRAIQIARDYDISRISVLIEAHQARIWLAQHKHELAASWAYQYSQLGETEYLREFEDLTLARTRIAQGKTDDALALLDVMQQSAEAAGRTGTVIEIAAVRAVALFSSGKDDEAIKDLETALLLSEPEGYIRVFIDEGMPMSRLLRQIVNIGAASNYVNQLLEAINAENNVQSADQTTLLVEPLSPRELEVLELLVSGLTNLEISQRLFISLPTVKSHTRNIYGKLGVHNRTAAVNRAKELGVLP